MNHKVIIAISYDHISFPSVKNEKIFNFELVYFMN